MGNKIRYFILIVMLASYVPPIFAAAEGRRRSRARRGFAHHHAMHEPTIADIGADFGMSVPGYYIPYVMQPLRFAFSYDLKCSWTRVRGILYFQLTPEDTFTAIKEKVRAKLVEIIQRDSIDLPIRGFYFEASGHRGRITNLEEFKHLPGWETGGWINIITTP